MITADPLHVGVAGDWHGNTLWACSQVEVISRRLSSLSEQNKVIVQCGDFGIWGNQWGVKYLNKLEKACAANDITVLFVDGNHENYDILERYDKKHGGQVRPHIIHLTRGTRWTWQDRVWLALGGAVSMDAERRRQDHPEGAQRSWWPQEEITADQADMVIAGGHADVMVTHDCPREVHHSFHHGFADWPLREVARSDMHRGRLQRVVDGVTPQYLIHGHLHLAYQRYTMMDHGEVQVTGLDMDGEDHNWHILNTATMEWEI